LWENAWQGLPIGCQASANNLKAITTPQNRKILKPMKFFFTLLVILPIFLPLPSRARKSCSGGEDKLLQRNKSVIFSAESQ